MHLTAPVMVDLFNVGKAALWMPLIPQAPPPPSHFTELLIVVHLTHTDIHYYGQTSA